MPTFNVKVGNAQYEVDAPDENTAWKWANATHAPTPEAPEESEMFKAGRQMPTWAQAGLKLGDVLSSGLAKRMAGPQTTEMVKGATAQFQQENPWSSFGAELAGTVPQMLVAPETLTGRMVSLPGQFGRAAAVSGVQGGLTGLGASEGKTPNEILGDVTSNAALGAGMGAATLGGSKVLGVVNPGIRRAGAAMGAKEFGTVTPSQRQLAVALSRSMPEDYAGSPGQYAIEQLQKLGSEGRIADVGESTRQLADLLATLPGRARQDFQSAIRERQSGRAGRLVGEAEKTLGKQGVGFSETLDALATKKQKESEPFYNALQYAQVPVDDELKSMLQRAGKEALGKANRLARLAGDDPVALKNVADSRDIITNAIIPGQPLNFRSLDQVKQSLYDLESKFARAGEKTEAAAFGNLRKQLTAKLDELSPKDDMGVSIYSKARNAFAGPAQLEDAVTLGREAFSKDSVELANLMRNMTSSEREAFQTGALQALRDKTGTESGQTSLLKYWKEPKTKDALHRIFGDKLDNYTAALDREAELKQFERVGQGSQTFGRESAAEDQGSDLLLAGAEAATKAGTSPWSLISTVKKGSQRLQMPENVRNQLATMLLQRGGSAEQELKLLDKTMTDLAKRRARSAALAGALGASETKIFKEK